MSIRAILKAFLAPLCVSLIVAPAVSHATHNCVGQVNNVDIDSGGGIHANISGIGDGNTFCSVKQQKGEFDVESCKGILSLLMAAQMSGKKVRVYFRNDANTSCNKGNWKEFTSAEYQFYYIRLEN